jgi:hypothetical protein
MSVTEYLDKFTHLSGYAPDEVNTDPKRQERFLDGLIGNWTGEQEEGTRRLETQAPVTWTVRQ